jgi:cytochrome c oxidase subunit IV
MNEHEVHAIGLVYYIYVPWLFISSPNTNLVDFSKLGV